MNLTTGIHYGAISIHSLASEVFGDAEPIYPESVFVTCPTCNAEQEIPEDLDTDSPIICTHENANLVPCGTDIANEVQTAREFAEPVSWDYASNDPQYRTDYSESLSCIFVLDSPFYTFCRSCSPCAPNAGDLDSPVLNSQYPERAWEKLPEGITAYCFGLDYFDSDSPCPYRVFRVSDDSEVLFSEEELSVLQGMAVQGLASDYPDECNVTVLYSSVSPDGTVTLVYESKGTRHYAAVEYTRDSDGFTESGGYETTEKYHCMGERYRGLFGPYESEVFYTC